MEDPNLPADTLPNAVRDEILLAGLLMPLASTNLRAPLRSQISITDASEFGGAAAEATQFVVAADENIQKLQNERDMALLENPYQKRPKVLVESVSASPGKCCRCGTSKPLALKRCPLGCREKWCSADCYLKHRGSCAHASLESRKVLVLSNQKHASLMAALIDNGISVEWEKPGRKRTPDAALVIALTRGPARKDTLQQLDALQNQRIEGRLAILWSGVESRVWKLKETRVMDKSLDIHQFQYSRFKLLHNLPAGSFSLLEAQSPPSKGKEGDGWDKN